MNWQDGKRLTDLENRLKFALGKDGGRDSQGVWDGHGHVAVFNMENQQGPGVQQRELCSILCNDLMVPRGKDGGRDSQGVRGGHGHTAVFNMENPQGPAVQHRELCSMSCGSLDGRGVWGGMDTCVCVAESLKWSTLSDQNISDHLYPKYKIRS